MRADVLEASYLPSGLSDHSPLAMKLRSPASRSAALWRLGVHWVTHPELTDSLPPLLAEFWERNAESSSTGMVWDSFKAYNMGQYIAQVKKQQSLETHSLQQAVTTQMAKYSLDPNPDQFDSLMVAQRELHLHLSEVTQLETFSGKQRFFEQGDKNGRLLAMLAQNDQPSTLVSELQTSEGEKVMVPSEILQTFSAFYKTLYTSTLPPDFQPEKLQDLLDPLALGWLSDQERETLVQPFTALEVLNAIHSFPPGKAPRPDGLPIDFYRAHYWPKFTQHVYLMAKYQIPCTMHT